MDLIQNKPRALPGQAPDGLYKAVDDSGGTVHLGETVLPILKQVEGRRWELIGTGFFISGNGVFATAKHVLHDVLDAKGQQLHPIVIFQFIPGNQYLIRPVMLGSHNTEADIAIGVLQQATHNETGETLNNKTLTLTTNAPKVGEIVATYAYPNTVSEENESVQSLIFSPAYYEGILEEYLVEGRDNSMLPGPCYRTSIIMHGGASGGPVVGPSGRVFAINSTGFHGADVSYVSRINEILPLSVNIMDMGTPRSLTVLEMARRGWVTFDPPL